MSGRDAFEMPRHVGKAVRYARERKAEDIAVLDLRHVSSATDFFVIVTGRSDIQVRAAVRDFYRLEALWGDARSIAIGEDAGS